MEPSQRRTKDFTFYFKSDSVIMEYHHQYVCFNNFSVRNKRALAKFSDRVKTDRYITLDSVFGYAREYDIPAISLTDSSAVSHLKRIN